MNVLLSRMLSRGFVTTTCRRAKPGYFLYKLIDREPVVDRRTRNRNQSDPQKTNTIIQEATRRQKVLNALYMESITDILASSFADELVNFKIQIHNVRILRNLLTVYVYWSSDESGIMNKDASIALEAIEPKVRRELSCVRHMGAIPKIKFVFYSGASNCYSVHTILDELRIKGELDGVEPIPLAVKDYPQVYGLDRDKILGLLSQKTLPANFLKANEKDEVRTEDFTCQFRKTRASYRLRVRNPKDDERWRRQAERILLQKEDQETHDELTDIYEAPDEYYEDDPDWRKKT